MALNVNPSRKNADLAVAGVLVAAASWAFVEAGAYPGFSGAYPRVLAALLAIGGVLVIIRRLIQIQDPAEPRLFINPPRFLLAVAVFAAYVFAIDMVGYLIPSLALGIGVPWMLGYRNFGLSVPVTFGAVIFIVLVFYVILERPLPADILDPLLGVLR